MPTMRGCIEVVAGNKHLAEIEMIVGWLRLGMIVGWLLSCTQGRRQKSRMIDRMMIGAFFSMGSPRIGHKPRMMLGWCEGGGWMVPGNLG